MNDIKYAWRGLLRAPGFAFSAILTLALGIGANSVIFTGVYRLLFDPMPFLGDQNRLASISEVAPGGRNDHNEYTLGAFDELRSSARSFSALAAHAWMTGNLSGGDRPERVQGFRVTADFFDTLQLRPQLGRTFRDGEDQPGRDDVVVISHGLWQRRFGGNPSILNQRISINGVQRTIVGIMPDGVRYPTPSELWVPFAYTPQQWANRRSHFLLVTGRLNPDVSMQEAQAELSAIAARLATSYPATNTGWGARVTPLIADSTRMIRPTLLGLFASVGLVLLIACASVANLLLARGTSRQRELAVRAALGAGRGRLRLQLFIESLVVAAAGGACGLLFCVWGVRAMAALVPAQQSRFITGFDRLGIDVTVIAFTAAVSVLTALLFGVLPAVKAAGRNLLPALQERARGSSGERHRIRKVLVGAEVALAVLLLIGAGLTVRSLQYALSADLGFEPDGIAATSVVIPSAKYATPADVARFYDWLIAEVSSLPGVQQAAAINVTPLCQCNETTSFHVVGGRPFERSQEPDVGYRVVTPAYFSAMGIPVRTGRAFSTRDALGQPLVIIINDTLARRFFENQNPLGQRLQFRGPETAAEIVGVVADVLHSGPAQPPQPEIYFPEAQEASQSMTLLVRTDADPGTLAGPIRAAVHGIDPDQPVYDQRTMRDVVNLSVGPLNFAGRLLTTMALVALFLSAVGIYGVIAHIVEERSREIGIRIALGGTRPEVVRGVVTEAMLPALLGLGIGLVGAGLVTNSLSAAFVGVKPTDPITFVSAVAALILAALMASYLPARRAARVDPVVTLRSE